MRYNEMSVIKIMHLLNANTSNLGYDYIVYSFKILFENERRIESIIKSLYFDVAQHYDTTWKCVERNIRCTIKSIWVEENDKILFEIFQKKSCDKRPTNKEFLKRLYEYIIHMSPENSIDEGMLFICPFSKQYCKAFTDYCIFSMVLQNKISS